jgi:hypothetical protein
VSSVCENPAKGESPHLLRSRYSGEASWPGNKLTGLSAQIPASGTRRFFKWEAK